MWMFISALWAQSPTNQQPKESIVPLSGVWVGAQGDHIIIPFVRDGLMPIIIQPKKGEPIIFTGLFDWQTQTVSFEEDSRSWSFSNVGHPNELTWTRNGTPYSYPRENAIPDSPISGIWENDSGKEFIPFVYDGRVWVLHKVNAQDWALQKGKWRQEGIEYTFKTDSKMTVEVYPNEPQLAYVTQSGENRQWTQTFDPQPFRTTNLTGHWKSLDGGLILEITMDGHQWQNSTLETAASLINYKGEWVTGTYGHTFWLTHKKSDKLVGLYDPDLPNSLTIRWNNDEYYLMKSKPE